MKNAPHNPGLNVNVRRDVVIKNNYGPFVKGNPGLGDKAWDNFHTLMAKFLIKYGKKLAEKEKELNANHTK